ISSSSTAGIEADVGAKFSVGINLAPLGGSFTLARATMLSAVNGSKGVMTNSIGTADFRVTLSDGTSFDVDIRDFNGDGTTTIGDVLDAFNASGPGVARFEAKINGNRTALVVVDHSNGSASFTVQAVNGSMAAMSGVGLGLVGSVNAADDDGNRTI